MREIQFDKFKLVEADATSAAGLTFSVMANNTIRIGSRLMKKLNAEFINFYVVDDGTVVAIKAVTADASEVRHVKKNGEVRSMNLCESLRRAGITLPARYNVEWCEANAFWQGEICKEYSFRKPQKAAPKKKKD